MLCGTSGRALVTLFLRLHFPTWSGSNKEMPP